MIPGRPTMVEHRAPEDDIRNPYDRVTAAPISKLNALTIVSAEHQVHDYYMSIGPTFADPIARTLYAEIAHVEQQHVSHYESLMDPDETWIEKWLTARATRSTRTGDACSRIRTGASRHLVALSRLRARADALRDGI